MGNTFTLSKNITYKVVRKKEVDRGKKISITTTNSLIDLTIVITYEHKIEIYILFINIRLL